MNRWLLLALFCTILLLVFLVSIFYEPKTIDLLSGNISLSDIDAMIKEDPKNGLLYYNKALIYLSSGNFRSSIENLDKSIELGFPITNAYIMKSVVYYRMKNYISSLYYASKAIEIDPTDYEGYLMRARAYYHLKDYEKSIEDFLTAYGNSLNDEILYELSQVYIDSGKYKEAWDILFKLYDKYPKNMYVVEGLYYLYKKMKFYNNALYLLSAMCRQGHWGYLKCVREKARIYYEMGDYILAYMEISKISKNMDADDIVLYCNVLIKRGYLKSIDRCLNVSRKKIGY